MPVFFVSLIIAAAFGLLFFSESALFCVLTIAAAIVGFALYFLFDKKKRWLASLFFFAGLAFMAIGQNYKYTGEISSYGAFLDTTEDLIRDGKLDDAREYLETFDEVYGKSDRSALLNARTYLEAKEYDSAIKELQNVSEKGYDYYYLLLRAYSKKSDIDFDQMYDTALEAADRLSENAEMQLLAGAACFEKKEFARALHYYGQAFILKPKDYLAPYYMARCFYELGDSEQTKLFLQKAQSRNPDSETLDEIIKLDKTVSGDQS